MIVNKKAVHTDFDVDFNRVKGLFSGTLPRNITVWLPFFHLQLYIFQRLRESIIDGRFRFLLLLFQIVLHIAF